MRRHISTTSHAPRPDLDRRARSVAGIAVAITVLATGLTACETSRFDEAVLIRNDPARRHPISVEVQQASLDLPATVGTQGLNSSLYLETTRFVRQYRRDGRGTLQLAVPRQGRDHHKGSQGVASVRYIIEQAGISPRHVKVHERHDGLASITLSYERIAAVAPVCGDWSESVTRAPETGPYANWGCASRRNLANMVAEPTDLIFPTSETDRGGDRRSAAYKDFAGKGEGGGGAAKAPASPAGAPAP